MRTPAVDRLRPDSSYWMRRELPGGALDLAEGQSVDCRDLPADDLTFRLLGIPHRIA